MCTHTVAWVARCLCVYICMYVCMYVYVCVSAKSLQSCLTLCHPRDSSPPGSPVPGTLQARTLEWVAISFSSAWKWKVKGKSLSRVRLLVTPWTTAYQAPPSMRFSRQEYWSGMLLPSLVYVCVYKYSNTEIYVDIQILNMYVYVMKNWIVAAFTNRSSFFDHLVRYLET